MSKIIDYLHEVDLTSLDKIKEYFSEETCSKFSKSGDSLVYDDETGIEVDEEDLTERLENYFDNIVKYGKATWSQEFDSQGSMEINWSDDIAYTAQLIITEPKIEEPSVIIYPQEYKD